MKTRVTILQILEKYKNGIECRLDRNGWRWVTCKGSGRVISSHFHTQEEDILTDLIKEGFTNE